MRVFFSQTEKVGIHTALGISPVVPFCVAIIIFSRYSYICALHDVAINPHVYYRCPCIHLLYVTNH